MARRTEHPPLRHFVLEEIRRQIVAGELQPGERLREEEIAAALGVSRNPVREAVQALDTEGFVRIEPRRGARVAVISSARARELFEVREVLEGLVASLAAQRCTGQQLVELQAIVEEGSRAARNGELTRLPALNTRFHHGLIEIAGNEMLAESIDRLRHLIEWVYSQRIAERAPQSWEEHGVIVEAIGSGDPAHAEHVARRHIARAREAYVSRQG